MTVTYLPTPLQVAVLDALGGESKSVRTLAFEMGISDSAVRGRLDGLWRIGFVDRRWNFHLRRLIWFTTRAAQAWRDSLCEVPSCNEVGIPVGAIDLGYTLCERHARIEADGHDHREGCPC